MNEGVAGTFLEPIAEAMGLNGTGLIALKYLPIPGVPEKIVEIFGASVCAAFLFAGLLYIVNLLISFRMDDRYSTIDESEKE